MNFVLFEDEKYSNFYPASRFRTTAEIRNGALTPKKRLELITGSSVSIYSKRKGFGNYSQDAGEKLFVNARLRDFSSFLEVNKNELLVCNGEIVAYRAEKPLNNTDRSRRKEKEVKAGFYNYIWDIISFLDKRIKKDIEIFTCRGETNISGEYLLKPENADNIYIGENVNIGKGVIINGRNGPVYIGDNSIIGGNTVIEGPVYLGEGCSVKPGSLLDTVAAGKVTKLSGEIEDTIFQSYSNKQHFGFLGHSYVGEWVNLGAGTTNSDLKNNYSSVRVNYIDEDVETDMQFLGLMIGDHSKTAINTSFNTGTIIEPFCNIFGRTFPPKYLPPFSWWGGKMEEYEIEKAIETAEKVMARRDIELKIDYEKKIRKVFRETSNLRK